MGRATIDRMVADVPLDLDPCLAAMEEQQVWQYEIDDLLHELNVDPQTLPSIEEVQAVISRYIPYEESLSDLVIAMREE